MDRTEFKKRMQSLKSYRENNPGKGYWDWKVEQFDEGGSVFFSKERQEEDRQWVINWLKRRQEYKNPAVQQQAKVALQRAEWDTRSPYTTKHSIYTVPVTYKNMRNDWGGYYHPNEGVVLNTNVDLQKYGEPLIHEFSHSVNTNNAQIRNTINTIIDKQKTIDRGSDVNTYLTSPEEIHSRLMEFRKLNNLDPTKRVGMPQLQYIKKHGKDRDLLNLFVDDQVVLDLLNNVATTKSSIIRVEDGGEVPPSDYRGSNEPARVNPITGKPLANGVVYTTIPPTLGDIEEPSAAIETALSFIPYIGDVMSVRDAYIAAKNKDLLGLGLAGLGLIPFVPRIGRTRVKTDRPPIPTVNKDAIQRQIDLSVSQTDKNKRVLDDFYNQRNRVYESLIENEDAFRRAARADRRSGTSYMQTYQDMVREYGRDGSNLNPNLAQPGYDRSLYEQPVKAQVSTSNPDLIRLNPRYKDPEELDETFQSLNSGLIRHEMGHGVDIKSGLNYTKSLADPSKFEPESKIKEMYPKSYKTIQDYLLNGSEIKSYMNEFRDFLFNKGEYQPKETINSIRKKLDKYGSQFKNLNILFDLYKNKRQFVNDYNLIPITATENNDNLV